MKEEADAAQVLCLHVAAHDLIIRVALSGQAKPELMAQAVDVVVGVARRILKTPDKLGLLSVHECANSASSDSRLLRA